MIHTEFQAGLATLRLARPPVNAFNPALVTAFQTALDAVERAPDVQLLIIDSDERAFCAGADLSLIQDFFAEPDGARRMVDYVTTLHTLFDRIESLPIVTLAVMRGTALGGGLELALACDLRLAASDAQLGLPEARVGMIPGAGGTQRLTRLCGPGVAARLILAAEVVAGDEAQRLGLVQWSAPAAAIDASVRDIARSVCGLSAPALVAAKDCIQAATDPDVDGYARELEKPAGLMATSEARQRIAAFFARPGGGPH